VSVSTYQLEQMGQSLQRLRDESAHAGVVLGSFWTSFGANVVDPSNAAHHAQETLLDALNVQIGLLGTSRWFATVGGLQSYEDWMNQAAATHRDLASIDRSLIDWTFGGVAEATVDATADTVVKGAAIGAAVATPILLAIGGLYLFMLFGRKG
jgi:hypothetical protein